MGGSEGREGGRSLRPGNLGTRLPCLALALLLLIPALPHAGASPDQSATLRVAIKPLASTNPLTADADSMNVLGLVYDSATKVDPRTGQRIPYIAVGTANLSLNTHNVTWADCSVGNFGYRPKELWEDPGMPEMTVFYDFSGVRWHDGVPMTVRDIMFSFHAQAHYRDAWLGHPLADRAGLLGSNYTDDRWLHIQKVWESLDGTRAALKFTLQKPFFNVFEGYFSAFVLPYHIWGGEASNQTMNNTLIWCDAGFNSSDQYSWKQYFAEKFTNPNPVGSGPFVWAGRSGGRITLKAWEGHFYRPGSTYYTYNSGACAEPGIGTLALTEYLSEDRAIWDLENDLLDLIAWDQPSAITRFAGSEDVSYQCLEPTYFAQMAFNLRRRSFGYDRDYSSTIFTDTDYGKPLRKALAHCVDAASMNSLANLATSNPPLAFASWKNLSAPAYAYDPSAAMSILNNTGYRQSNPGSALGADNRWLNPDGTEIGSLPDGSIELLVPESSEDLIMYQAGEVLAGQMRAIGLRTELVQLNSTALAQRLESRDFDMCVVGHWITPAERKRPETFYYTMLHSDMAMYGPNFCGYGNSSLDTILAHAMAATDRARHLRYVQDCESTMDYDVPLYTIFRASATEFYRADNFEGFADGGSGTLLNALTLANLAKQEKAILRSRFIGVPITWQSNSTKPVLVKVTDQDGRAVQGADVTLACSAGTLLNLNGRTDVYGQFSTDFTAPYVPVTEEYTNTMTVRLSVTSAILVGYRPAIRADFAITVFPERLRTMSIRAFADPDTVTARDSFGNPGFTLVSVTVRDGANMPVDGALLRLRPGDGNITLSAEETRTDEGGQAEFRVYASDVAGIAECNITINATKGGFRNASQEVALTVLPYEPGDAESGATMLERLALPIIMAACSFAVAGTVHILRRRRRAG